MKCIQIFQRFKKKDGFKKKRKVIQKPLLPLLQLPLPLVPLLHLQHPALFCHHYSFNVPCLCHQNNFYCHHLLSMVVVPPFMLLSFPFSRLPAFCPFSHWHYLTIASPLSAPSLHFSQSNHHYHHCNHYSLPLPPP